MAATVYIPTLNRPEMLERALASLAAQTVPVRVVVIDNGDGGLAAEHPDVLVVTPGENLGFGRAVNLAVRTHPGDPVILINDDVECEPSFAEAMLDRTDGSMVAGVLRRALMPGVIDSAGVAADRTLFGFQDLA